MSWMIIGSLKPIAPANQKHLFDTWKDVVKYRNSFLHFPTVTIEHIAEDGKRIISIKKMKGCKCHG